MDWNEITATVESQLAELEEALAGEERQLAQRQRRSASVAARYGQGARRSSSAARSGRRSTGSWKSHGVGGDADPAEDAGLADEPGPPPLAAGGDG